MDTTDTTRGSAENSSDQRLKVYIWDMDETLILLKSLLNRTYAEAFNGLKDVQKGVEIGNVWENHILQVCDDYFFYEQVSLLCIMLCISSFIWVYGKGCSLTY